jgi:ATP-dependent DNA ligase
MRFWEVLAWGREPHGLILVEYKYMLRALGLRRPSRSLYVERIGGGVGLFHAVCEQDMEGIVAKHQNGVYDPAAPTLVKIKNRNYSQAVERHDRFERMRVGE